MSGSGITIAFEDVPAFSLAFQAELKAFALRNLGGDSQAAAPTPAAPDGGSRVAQLTQEQADLFLENCGNKSVSVLKQVIARKGTFTLAEIAAALRLRQGELRGVWGGLTKRVRTVTGKKEALLIDWKWIGGKWHGSLASATTTSFTKALKNY